MLAGGSIDYFSVDGEVLVHVLRVDIRVYGGNSVIDLISGTIAPSWLNAQDIHTYTACETVIALECSSGVYFRDTAVFQVVIRSTVRTCREVLHLIDDAAGQCEVLREVVIEHHLRGTAERVERGTCLEVDYIWLICCERMPCLSDFEGCALTVFFTEVFP